MSLIEKCLQKLLKALYKDRSHAIAHYKHTLSSKKHNIEGIIAEKAVTLSRLTDIDKAVDQTVSMLKRYPEFSKNLSQFLADYTQALQIRNDLPLKVFNLSRNDEENILSDYQVELLEDANKKKIQAHSKDKFNMTPNPTTLQDVKTVSTAATNEV